MPVTYRRMVALGSSFAAGPGLKPYDDKKAMRSLANYPHLVAESLGCDLTDATVSGATTSTILSESQRLLGRKFAPQIEAIHPDTDLVTLTAGGNDLGYLGGILGTALLYRLGRSRLGRPVATFIRAKKPLITPTPQAVESATIGLVQIVEEVRRRAPRARVVLVDYLPIFDADTATGPQVPLHDNEIAHFRQVAAALSAAFAEAARRSGADLIPAGSFETGHGAGSADPWIFGMQLSGGFHPTYKGMEAVAHRVLAYLGKSSDPAV